MSLPPRKAFNDLTPNTPLIEEIRGVEFRIALFESNDSVGDQMGRAWVLDGPYCFEAARIVPKNDPKKSTVHNVRMRIM